MVVIMKYRLTNYIKKNIKYLIIIILLIIIITYCDLMLPDYMAKIIDVGVKDKNFNYIYKTGTHMVLFALISLIANIIVGYFSSILSNKISHNIRCDLYNKLIKLDSFQNKISPSSLINRLTVDVNQVNSGLFMILRIVIMAPIIGIFASIKVLNTNKRMSLIIFSSIIIMLFIITILFKKVFSKIKISKELLDKINLITKENLSGIKTIKAFNKQKYMLNKFDNVNKDILNVNNYINKIMLLLSPLVTLIINITTIIIVYIGTKEILVGNFKIGKMIAYIEYMLQLLSSFLMISLLFVIIPKMSVSNKRIKEVINLENKIENSGKHLLNTKNINIEFSNVTFSYNKENKFLSNINFKIENKDKIGIIGSFASGKTTLINLLTRIYDVDSGYILINNKNIKEYDINNLRKNISVALQENIIFEGTIKSNILYRNKNTNNETLKKIWKISKLCTFVKFDELGKYKTSYEGKNLSGGEKKRLSIASALAKKANIYIFDDPSASLDYKNASEIIDNIIKYLDDKIVIIVSQRISNIKNLDKIIVMDNGKIDNIGNHEYLLNNSKIYKQIYDSQNIWGEEK